MIVAYLQWSLLVSAALLLVQNRYRLPFLKNAWLIPAAVLIVLALPLGTVHVYGYFWGIFGQLSVTTTLLLAGYVADHLPGPGRMNFQFRRPLLYGPVALASVMFYPLALGVSPVDPYGWGYQPFYLAIVLLVAASILWVAKQRLLAWLTVAVVLCHQAGLLESDNLWDYLLDPFLAVYSWGWGVRRLQEYFRIRARARP